MWRTGLVAPWHVGSSQTRARTRVSCIGRRILNHCTTREVPPHSFLHQFSLNINSESLCLNTLPLCLTHSSSLSRSAPECHVLGQPFSGFLVKSICPCHTLLQPSASPFHRKTLNSSRAGATLGLIKSTYQSNGPLCPSRLLVADHRIHSTRLSKEGSITSDRPQTH